MDPYIVQGGDSVDDVLSDCCLLQIAKDLVSGGCCGRLEQMVVVDTDTPLWQGQTVNKKCMRESKRWV